MSLGSVIVKYEDSLDAAGAFLNMIRKYKLNVQHKGTHKNNKNRTKFFIP
jgi:hypothetical protein